MTAAERAFGVTLAARVLTRARRPYTLQEMRALAEFALKADAETARLIEERDQCKAKSQMEKQDESH